MLWLARKNLFNQACILLLPSAFASASNSSYCSITNALIALSVWLFVAIDMVGYIQMMHTDCTVPYGEVDGLSALLGYQTANAAGCKVTATILCCCWWSNGVSGNPIGCMTCGSDVKQVLIHPRWGTSVYPATLFTKAPVTVLRKIIEEVEAEATGTGYYQDFMSV